MTPSALASLRSRRLRFTLLLALARRWVDVGRAACAVISFVQIGPRLEFGVGFAFSLVVLCVRWFRFMCSGSAARVCGADRNSAHQRAGRGASLPHSYSASITPAVKSAQSVGRGSRIR